MNVLQETRPSGEAGLIIPDLSSVDFLGMHGRTLLMGGLAVCALGLLFGLIIYGQLKRMPVHQSMLDHPGGTVRALESMAAVAAQRKRCKTAAVEEQQRLLAAFEVGFHLGDERRGQPAPARRRVLRQVDRADLG